ncbi:MAG: hypothetical protein M1812_005504 [Candelaria pacifica]|nr:MAG: hypothetical protein M1812_005504 [Candelaria pacifica]
MAAPIKTQRCILSEREKRGNQEVLCSRSPINLFADERCTVEEKRYTKDHEWIELSDDGSTGTIGVSKYAANSLGDVVYVELPTMDLEVNAGDSIGAVESVKSASDIMTPVSGKITGANEGLEVKPSLINQGPEGEGWIAKISVKDKKEIEELMSLEEYRTFTEE